MAAHRTEICLSASDDMWRYRMITMCGRNVLDKQMWNKIRNLKRTGCICGQMSEDRTIFAATRIRWTADVHAGCVATYNPKRCAEIPGPSSHLNAANHRNDSIRHMPSRKHIRHMQKTHEIWRLSVIKCLVSCQMHESLVSPWERVLGDRFLLFSGHVVHLGMHTKGNYCFDTLYAPRGPRCS